MSDSAGHRVAARQAQVPAKVATSEPSPPRSYRITAGYGYGIGSHSGTFELLDGTLRSRAGIGSDGDTMSLQGWVDGWIGRDWSFGLEYLNINNSGKLILSMPNGVSLLTDPISVHAYSQAHGQLIFTNIAYRPSQKKSLMPYLGVGLGVGYGNVAADLEAGNAFVGDYHFKGRSESVFTALQGFVGVDVEFSNNYYLASFGKLVWAPGDPYGLDHSYFDVVIGGGLGRKF